MSTETAKCLCPQCGEIIPCERVHNGLGYVFHAVHCGYGHEVEPINESELDARVQRGLTKLEKQLSPEAKARLENMRLLMEKRQMTVADLLEATRRLVSQGAGNVSVLIDRTGPLSWAQLDVRDGDVALVLRGSPTT